jgi:hypothetical protein
MTSEQQCPDILSQPALVPFNCAKMPPNIVRNDDWEGKGGIISE